MKAFYDVTEFQSMMNDANQIIVQIDKLRVDIGGKICVNDAIEEDLLKVMGDSMSVIADMLEMPLQKEEMENLYSELKRGILPKDICDKLLVWENNMCEWSHILSERYSVCNICKKMVRYSPNNNYFREKQRLHGFQYWNAIFESISTEKRICPVCSSLDRERMLSLMIDLLQPNVGEKLKVLQIAPSYALDSWLKAKDYLAYETTDLMMPNVTYQSDIQNMHMVESETYDIIICSHILEHVKDDQMAMRELYRVLKPEGVCLFLVPLVLGLDKTDEEFGLSAEENWKRFGQDDHARLYSKEDFLNRLVDAGYKVHILGKEYFGEENWKEQGLSDIHYLYAATKKDIGIGVEPYHPVFEQEELVSVVIPTYNRGYCIKRAISSVLNQTWRNLEVIVVDDASTDDTEKVVKSIDDERVKYIRVSENRGANHARNIGVQAAKGNFVAFNDSDDEWLPLKLEKQMKQLVLADRTEGNVGCVYCVVTRFENGNAVSVAPDLRYFKENVTGDIYRFMQSNMFISTQTIVLKKEVFNEVGLFNEGLKRLQDWELLLRVAQKYKFTLVQESLVNAYIQNECISKNTKGWIETVLYVIKEHDMHNVNKTAAVKLLGIMLNMIRNSDLEEKYVYHVYEEIERLSVI